jgi:carotenoid phi-ring synthase / carotenoid chi-ring synthase
MPERSPVIVIGAGLAGLTAALHLAERGVPVLVLEADPTDPGGRVAGKAAVKVNGWRFPGEHGVHGIWSPYLNLQAMLSRHRIRPVFVPAQEEDWIYRSGKRIKKAAVGSAIRDSWIPAPFHYLNLFLRPSFLASLGVNDWISLVMVYYTLMFAVGIDPLREDQPLEGLKMSDLVSGWSPALRAFMIGLTRSGLSGHPDEIPLSGFIAFLRFYTVLRRDAWAFSYLPADAGTSLIRPMVGRLEALGGSLQMDARVTQLVRTSTGWRVTWQSNAGPQTGGTFEAEQVILAADSPNTAKILQGSPSTADLAEDMYFPTGLETAVVRLWFDRAPLQSSEAGIFSGDFIADNFFWLDQIQEPYLRWHKATGGSAIEVHIYGPPTLLAQSDVNLLTRAISDVQIAFPELREHRIHQFLQRNPATHTLFGLGPTGKHLGIQTPWPGLFCCGDWVRHPNPALFLERACVTGIAAANAALETRGLPTWPLLDHPKPEPFVGWIEKLMVKGRQARRKRRN